MSRQGKKKETKAMAPSYSPQKSEELCPVCHDHFKYYAIGQCDHPVCYRCSTRMRVLCELQHCPICRTDMPKVVFVKTTMDFANILTHRYPYNRKYKIYFEDDHIQQAFHELLDNRCQQCEEIFRTFKDLERHKRRHHDLHACEICTKHLKIFPHERKFYNRKDLALHKRVGDTNDKSHRGHPLCEFCEERYLDNDELVRHLRKDHYFCHFCDADGISNQFYSDYSLLRNHFRDSHFLCEEGDCQFVEFTNAFHYEIDYKAHVAQLHSKNMRKGQAKQTRTIDIEVNLKPRPSMGRGKRREETVITGEDYLEVQRESDRRGGYTRGRGRGRPGGRGQGRGSQANREEEELALALKASLDLQEKKGGHIHVVDPALVQGAAGRGRQRQDSYHAETADFPTLNGQVRESEEADESSSGHKSTLAKKLAFGVNMSVQNGAMDDDDFPALGGASQQEGGPAAIGVSTEGRKPRPQGQPSMLASGGASKNQPKLWSVAQNDFPTSGQSAKPKNPVQEDFPSLPSRPVHSATSDGWKSVQKPVIKLQNAPSKASKSAKPATTKQLSRPHRERSPEPVPVMLDNPRLSNTMSQQVSLIQGTDITPEPPPKSVQQHLPPSKSQTSWFEDFPALGGGSGRPVQKSNQQWGASKTPKASQPASEKKSKPPGMDDFPALKKKTPVMPVQTYVPQSWTEIADSPSPTHMAEGDGRLNPAQSLLHEEDVTRPASREAARSKEIAKNTEAEDFPSLSGKNEKKQHDFSSHWNAASGEIEKVQEESGETSGELESQSKAKRKSKGKKKHEKGDSSGVGSATGEVETSSEAVSSGKLSKKKKPKGKEVAAAIDSSGYLSSENKDTKPAEKRKKKAKKDDKPMKDSVNIDTDRTDKSSTSVQAQEECVQGVPAEEHTDKSEDSFSDSDFKDALDDFPALSSVTKPAARPVVEVKPTKPVVTLNVDNEEPPKPKEVPTLSSIGASLEPATNADNEKQKETVTEFSTEDFPVLVNTQPRTVIPTKDVSLNTAPAVELSLDDFPALGGKPAAKMGTGAPPGFMKAAVPPGFSSGPPPGMGSKPPPGFKSPSVDKPKSSPVLSLKDITVKTDTDVEPSVGTKQEAAMVPSIKYEYQQPADFQERNHKLIEDIQALCDGDASKFDRFKLLSGQYRQGQLLARDYYTKCSDLLGAQNFAQILPELVTLLPDIEKQQGLFQAQAAASRPQGKKPKKGAWSTAASNSNSLQACPNCRQVLSQQDFASHSHDPAEGDFPALGGSAGSSHSVLRAWVKAT